MILVSDLGDSGDHGDHGDSETLPPPSSSPIVPDRPRGIPASSVGTSRFDPDPVPLCPTYRQRAVATVTRWNWRILATCQWLFASAGNQHL